MKLQWNSKAKSDLIRLHDFIAPQSRRAAGRVMDLLSEAPERSLVHPRLGERLEKFDPHEVRRLIIQDYELRYEILDETILILRIWHTREDR